MTWSGTRLGLALGKRLCEFEVCGKYRPPEDHPGDIPSHWQLVRSIHLYYLAPKVLIRAKLTLTLVQTLDDPILVSGGCSVLWQKRNNSLLIAETDPIV